MLNKMNMIAGLGAAFGYESVSVTNAAKPLNSGVYTDSDGEYAKRAVITVETMPIRYRYDGTDPTSSEGHLLQPMDVLTLIGSSNIQNFRVIRQGGTNATIKVTYEN